MDKKYTIMDLVKVTRPSGQLLQSNYAVKQYAAFKKHAKENGCECVLLGTILVQQNSEEK